MKSILLLLVFTTSLLMACAKDQATTLAAETNSIKIILNGARRIPTSDGWFEVIELPNDVYAFYEPGHVEQVNSFLILGKKKTSCLIQEWASLASKRR